MINAESQKGDFLLESLVGMVLMAIIGLGVVSVTAGVSHTQSDMNVQAIVINQMRLALVQNKFESVDICATPPTITLPNEETVTVTMQGCSAGAGVTIDATISPAGGSPAIIAGVPRPIVISASSSAFEGDIVVGGRWE